MGVWGQSPQAGVEPLHPLQNFYFAVLAQMEDEFARNLPLL
jgi:hypothetical protein